MPAFRHVLVVVFENKDRAEIGPAAPTFASLGRRYATLTDYRSLTHPSLPNYLALVSGSTQGITDDCTACVARGRSLADTLTAAGRTWKTYAEGYPSGGRYAKKHDPFAYFPRADKRRIVPFTRLRLDVTSNSLPDFALVVPDLCHDMHDCPVATGDAWLRREIEPLLATRALRGSVVFVVFDESGGGATTAAMALGPAVRPHSHFDGATGHYGVLRTIEDAWALPRLGASARAKPITGIWR